MQFLFISIISLVALNLFSYCRYHQSPLGVIHMWRPLWGRREGEGWGGGGLRQKWDVIRRRGSWIVSVNSGRPVFIFLLNKIGFTPWSDIILIMYYWQEIVLLTLMSDWNHLSITPLHCLWAKSNNRKRGWLFFFAPDFVHSHARCGCSSTVCLGFQVIQIKQVDCKMNTKKNFFLKKKRFLIFLGNCTHKNVKPRKSR